jgi:hypothetical protein
MAGTRPGRPASRPPQLILDMLDQALGPQQLLLAAEADQQRAVHQGKKVDAQLGAQLHSRALVAAGGQQRPSNRAR